MIVIGVDYHQRLYCMHNTRIDQALSIMYICDDLKMYIEWLMLEIKIRFMRYMEITGG